VVRHAVLDLSLIRVDSCAFRKSDQFCDRKYLHFLHYPTAVYFNCFSLASASLISFSSPPDVWLARPAKKQTIYCEVVYCAAFVVRILNPGPLWVWLLTGALVRTSVVPGVINARTP
jgi:hypothetical protein